MAWPSFDPLLLSQLQALLSGGLRSCQRIVGILGGRQAARSSCWPKSSAFSFSGCENTGSSSSWGTIASFNSVRGKGKGMWISLEYLHFCQDVTAQPRLCPEQLANTSLVEPEAFVVSKDKITVPVKDCRWRDFRFKNQAPCHSTEQN